MNAVPTYGTPRTRNVRLAGLFSAGMTLAMLLTQLYGFEDFSSVLDTVLPFNDQSLAMVVSAAVVLIELLSLPYLLAMYLSPLMRVVSAAAAGIVGLFWLFVTLISAHTSNVGIFSSTIEIPGGLIAAAWSLILAGMLFAVLYVDIRSRPYPTS